MAKASRNDSQGGGENTALRGFVSKISRYFLDFLQTDFKVQRAPRRRIQLKTESGFRTGMPLRKYDNLLRDIWAILDKPVGEKPTIRIPRGRYKAQLSSAMRDLLKKTVNNIDNDAFRKVRLATIAAIKDLGTAKNNPEAYIEKVQTVFADAVNLAIVTPLLATLEGEFEKSAYSALESVFAAQTDILLALTTPALEQLPTALNTYIVKDSMKQAESVLASEFDEKESKKRLLEYFEDLASADAYQELRDITNHVRMGGQDLQLYLYVCDIRYGHNAYPMFYIPATISFDELNGDMVLTLDPHLYAHKHAIDFIQQETKGAANLALSPIDNRILYLEETDKFIDEIKRLMVKLFTQFDLKGDFDVTTPAVEIKESLEVKVSKSAYIAAYDKNDQSVVNDYEQLLTALDENDQEVMALFHDLVGAIILSDNPIDITSEVEKAWAGEQTYTRLVARSPIPLNEEQRRVLVAKNDPRCRFITLQGPPGTGKSHTISAIAFDAIERGESCLVLSDKNEALDVVEDKLNDVLAVARGGDDDFPNPILRLGRVGGTYGKLVTPSALTKIISYHAAVNSRIEDIERELEQEENRLKTEIEQTIESFTSVNAKDIRLLFQLEKKLNQHAPGLANYLMKAIVNHNMPDIKAALDQWDANPGCLDSLPENTSTMTLDEARLLTLGYRLASHKRDYWEYREILNMFDGLCAVHLNDLRSLMVEYQAARMPIFGYLFRGEKLRELGQRAVKELGCRNAADLHKKQVSLKLAEKLVTELYDIADNNRSFDIACATAYRLLSSNNPLPGKEVEALGMILNRLQRTMVGGKQFLDDFRSGSEKLPSLRTLLVLAEKCVRYMYLYYQVHHVMANPPAIDFRSSKSKLEAHYTTLMTYNLDKRFITFMRENKADAKDIGGIIRGKKKFPVDKFPKVKNAFPVIIAGIREFAEYVPLRKEAFDVVVIDEASQVSVAQALPAILRAKTVIVLGDKRQFSNVKSMQASIAHNNNYLSDIKDYFKKNIRNSQDKLERLVAFDVKKSVLEFFDLCSNYSDMLRKHFRGYQELISFSSETFYDNQLQAIKIRGKPIEDILRFTQVTPVAEEFKNTNKAEAEYILGHLRELVSQENPPTVGIITPHREQQKYLTNLIMRDQDASRFSELLRLKIMTFDTCQGEERDLILYSMVATKEHDVLNFVFPVSLTDAADKIDQQLKMQRLNVGFSRARECMHFVLSKPISEYGGTVRTVLNHYQRILADKSAPETADTDQSSPMEALVLNWIKQSPFYKKNRKRIDLKAQFPIGEYLRQLDHTYHHPNWRVDFLLVYRHNNHDTKIIIEYDGFAEHFTDRDQVHEGNYESFYKKQDIERQMVIESYGYKFLRLNRFNLGEDPVESLSKRLAHLADTDQDAQRSESQEKVKQDIKDIEENNSKVCKRCDTIKPLEEFYDRRLKGGAGAIGSVCRRCKRLPGML